LGVSNVLPFLAFLAQHSSPIDLLFFAASRSLLDCGASPIVLSFFFQQQQQHFFTNGKTTLCKSSPTMTDVTNKLKRMNPMKKAAAPKESFSAKSWERSAFTTAKNPS